MAAIVDGDAVERKAGGVPSNHLMLFEHGNPGPAERAEAPGSTQCGGASAEDGYVGEAGHITSGW